MNHKICLMILLLANVNMFKSYPQRIKPLINGTVETNPIGIFASVCVQSNSIYKQHCFCGASFITTRLVLTAAHCVNEISVNKLIILFGATIKDYGKNVNVIGVYAYTPPSWDISWHDLAVLVLEPKLRDNDIETIDYPTYSPSPSNVLTIFGHSAISPGQRSELKRAYVTVVSSTTKTCHNFMIRPNYFDSNDPNIPKDILRGSIEQTKLLHSAHFCGSSDTCMVGYGDTGGPGNNYNSLTLQVGVIRMGDTKCLPVAGKFWQIFIDINYPPYQEWIKLFKTYVELNI